MTMQSTIRTTTVLLAGTALAGLSSPLLAQSAGPPQSEVDEVQDDQPDVASGDNAIVVTGTRIRGARIIGDTISLDRETIVEAGQIDLGEAIRSLPQNFSGGQNPGIGSGAGFANSNVNSASSANLRGLGPDATLTLLNGHRLPYDSAFAGVDISSIPLAAVDRIEVVPDGASALYGSDAVAGVVNVILRRDFEGITTSAEIG
ncbi:MAG TPA: TonB-dependent receptor, partial [Henriciella marina]|nr:TonB-dependent receptor [Henriciella marina]